MGFQDWIVFSALMVLCGLAMARLLWILDGRPSLRRTQPVDPTDPSRGRAGGR